MPNLKILLLILLLAITNASAQSTWEKLFSQVSTDVFRSVQNVPGGGYILAGYTSDSTLHDTDAYIVRITNSGDTSWTYRYDGSAHGKDLFYKVITTADGGFIAAGYTTAGTSGSDDVLYIKFSSSGSRQWTKTWGGSGRDRAQDIIQLASGGYILTGYSTSSPAQYYDVFLLKTDGSGDEVWNRYFGSSGYDDANAVKVLSDGGFILAGQSDNGSTGLDHYLVRTNSSGNMIWQMRSGTSGTDNAESILVRSSGFLLAGGSNGGGGNVDKGYVVKTDTAGNTVWTKFFGTTGPDDFHRIETTADGNFILSGTTSSSGPLLPNLWLVKMDPNGDEIWSKTFGRDNHDHGYSAVQAPDGGYILAGHSGSFGFNNEDGIVIKTDGSGNVSNPLTYTTVYQMTIPSGCARADASIQLVIRNFGETTVPNVPVTVNSTGAASINETGSFPSSFPAEAIDTVTISNVDLSASGNYTFSAFTNNQNDVYPARNKLITTMNLSPCVGIEELEESAFSVYPTPASSYLVVELNDRSIRASMELIDLSGRVFESKKNISNGRNTFDLLLVPNGMYFLRLQDQDGKVGMKKVLVSR
jgi:hypothetical protein